MPEQGSAPLFDKPTGPLGAVLQKRHHVGEKLEVAGVAGLMRLLSTSLANVAQSCVGPFSERLKHGGMLTLQNPPPTDLVLISLRDGLGVINPLLEKKLLSPGRGQLRLRRAKGGCEGVRTPRHFGQFGPEGCGPALSLGLDQPQPRLVFVLEG